MRLLAFFALLVAASSVTAQIYSKPTFNQAERLIGAVKEAQGDSAAYTAACAKTSSVYSQPTYAQIERLITEVRKGTNATAEVSGSRYLSIWDGETGLPLTNRTAVTYRPGDIYIVGNVSTNTDVGGLYEHFVTMTGNTDDDLGPSLYTNLTFVITNDSRLAFASFNDVYLAVSNRSTRTKTAVTAQSGKLYKRTPTAPYVDEYTIYYLAADILNNPWLSAKINEEAEMFLPGCALTNALMLADVVTRVQDTGVRTLSADVPSAVPLNFRPAGSSYVPGVSSLTQETNELYPSDVYWYDGADWHLLSYRKLVDTIWAEGTNVVADMIIKMTGIHIGEPNLKQQYDKGVWTYYATNTADKTVEIGFNAHATETASSSQAIAIGRDALSSGSATVAVGPNAFAQKEQSIAVGWRANAVGTHAIAIGGAKKSGEDYYKAGSVNPDSDLQLAEGDYSVAVGYNNKARGARSAAVGYYAAATADDSVQLGCGTNTTAHTLKFENVTIVKDGRVVGSAPDPQIVDPTGGVVTEELEMTVAPGSMTTLLPSVPVGPGSEAGVSCSGLRNYTLYLPNEATLRAGLPITLYFELPTGITGTFLGTNTVTKLPCRVGAEQPYGRLAVVTVTPLDDGYDWSPSVTNCTLVYKMDTVSGDNSFCCTNGVFASLQGESLQCGTAYTLSYERAVGGTTNTVSMMSLPAGASFMRQTFYGYVGAASYKITASADAPKMVEDAGRLYIPVRITYTTLHGSATFTAQVDVVD